MNKKRIIIIICIILVISLVYIAFVNIFQEKKETENVDSYSKIYDNEGHLIYDMSKEKEVIETVENTTIQGVVELNHNGYIYIFNGQHFGEYGFEMPEYSRANIDNKNQKCIDYFTLEEYDTNYIQEGDIIICTGDLKKFYYGDNDFDTKENDIIVLKKDDFNTMKQKVFESENPIITVGDVYIFDKESNVTSESHLYLKYDIEDNTTPDIVHHFPFGEEVYLTEETEIKGNLQKGKKVKVEYDYSDKESNNAKYADERLKLKSIEVIE